MADYSIDDILAELDAKKNGKNKNEAGGSSDAYQGGSGDLTATSILSGISDDMSATSIIKGIQNPEMDKKSDISADFSAYDEVSRKGVDRVSRDLELGKLTGGMSDVEKVLSETDTFAISEEEEDKYFEKREQVTEKAPEPESKKKAEEPELQIETEEQSEQRLKLEAEKRRLMLEKERENTNPDDMLDLVNPLEVKEKVISQAKEKDLAPVSEFSGMYAGNTQGIAGEDLKAIPPAKTDIAQKVDDKKDEENAPVKEYPARKGTTALIEKLNKSLEEKRRENLKTHRTITLGDIKGKPTVIAHPLNIDYKKQIIEATGALPEENPVIEQEKRDELSAAKKHKLKDFVLEDDSAAEESAEETEEDAEEEFDDYDSTGQIWADLCASHKGLKVRMALLSVITLISLFIAALNDFNLFGVLGMDGTFNFMNIRGDANSLVYIYLVCGVLGFATCSTVISNGLIKLFTGKADCDSVCAVTAALSIVGGVIALIDMQSFKLGHTYIYISTALVSLIFNTIGKLYMIVRAKRNFKFVSGDSTKYYADIIDNEASVSALTRAVSDRMPVIAAMRKTEFLTDFLKSSYCDDAADRLSARLVPISIVLGLLAGVLAYFNPFASAFPIEITGENPIFWAISSAIAVITAASPFSILLIINRPLSRASKQLSECNTALLGYEAATKFAEVNTVMVDAKTLFPAGSVVMHRVKRCQKKKSVIKISVEDAILMAASISIHTDGILSYLFYDVTLGNKDLLQKVDNCIYEDNCGVTGWIGTKRVMLGGRALMETHNIDLPSLKNENKYCSSEFEPVYLAVSGEVVAMFVIGMSPNPEIKSYMQQLQKKNITLLIRTTDSVVTVEKLADLFELDPELIKILPHDAHEEYNACTKYTSKGSGELSTCGTFTSFARGILAAKTLVRDFMLSKQLMICGAALGVVLCLFMILFRQTSFIVPSVITIYNTLCALAVMAVQKFRKY